MDLNKNVAIRDSAQQYMQKTSRKLLRGGVTSRFSCSILDLLVLAASPATVRRPSPSIHSRGRLSNRYFAARQLLPLMLVWTTFDLPWHVFTVPSAARSAPYSNYAQYVPSLHPLDGRRFALRPSATGDFISSWSSKLAR